MTKEELFRKTQQLFIEFELYLLEHKEIEEKIPDNATIYYCRIMTKDSL
jgi:hypothetical protein